LIDLVDIVLISEQEQVRKPDPRIFARAAERLGVRTQECVFVGDNPQADICGAHQVGMKTVWCAHGESWPVDMDIRPGHTINQLTELLSVPF
jgi:putative hydrolase of the HAD superfamily